VFRLRDINKISNFITAKYNSSFKVANIELTITQITTISDIILEI
jgi:hypothetical protein